MPEAVYFTLDEVATMLHKSRRWLWDWLARHPHDRSGRPFYRMAGRTRLFRQADIDRMLEEMRCPSHCARHARVNRRTTRYAAPTSASLLNEVRGLLTKSSR